MSKNKSIKKEFADDIYKMAMNDNSNSVRSTAFFILGEWKTEVAKQDMIGTLYDSSYLVASSALYALKTIDKDTAYIMAKELTKTNPGGDLKPEIWITIGEHASSEDSAYFNNELYNVSGRKKIDFVNALALYMKNVSSDTAFAAMLKHAKYLVTTENIKSYRAAMAGFLFELSKFYKYEVDATNTRNTTAKAFFRYNQLKSAMTSIVALETDSKNKEDYELRMRDSF